MSETVTLQVKCVTCGEVDTAKYRIKGDLMASWSHYCVGGELVRVRVQTLSEETQEVGTRQGLDSA